MRRAPHTSCRRGKWVRLALRDGRVVVDKFVERTPKFIVLESHRFTVDQIKTFGIMRVSNKTSEAIKEGVRIFRPALERLARK